MAHRTIRAFTEQPVSNDELHTLFQVARHTATAAFLQQATLIHVRDQSIRDGLCQVSGQKYVGGTRGELFVFVADLYRNATIRHEAGIESEVFGRTNMFFEAIDDTLLAAQNVVVAAESMGLGTVYLGSLNSDPRRVIDLLKLPRLTYPILGLLVGHPDQSPMYKPRLPLSVTVGVDTYPHVESYSDVLNDYDALVTEYYDLREAQQRIDSFTHQVRTRAGTGASELSPILEVLHEQGLVLH
ncbi:nitroreductase family protein [Schaalia sp. lx-100]|uniref:nitroreductase family protein n=1 Tax=Schaalia sp. lx-100 TaxID=2899081 RepID=UPI001E577302|nr:nitroreductase family protein [Schaalia sp. lx-100]MCD4557890.1 nitroreductase family protein [Schaalia sp. lx-100]